MPRRTRARFAPRPAAVAREVAVELAPAALARRAARPLADAAAAAVLTHGREVVDVPGRGAVVRGVLLAGAPAAGVLRDADRLRRLERRSYPSTPPCVPEPS